MASHELHVCATFSRSFFWTDLNLWPEDLAPGSVVLLSGGDDLMNAQQVKAMLEEFDHIKVSPAAPSAEASQLCCHQWENAQCSHSADCKALCSCLLKLPLLLHPAGALQP